MAIEVTLVGRFLIHKQSVRIMHYKRSYKQDKDKHEFQNVTEKQVKPRIMISFDSKEHAKTEYHIIIAKPSSSQVLPLVYLCI